MLPKNNRLTTALFKNVWETGSFVKRSRFFILKRLQTNNETKIAVVVPKKIHSKAVDRNELKRLVVRAWNELIQEKTVSNSHWVCIVNNKDTTSLPYLDIKKELKRLVS